ncbi:unnamed protein product [Callosobruchus maculatus]|uniref:Uncharacterized protein n=1 Tax=Callosobruchus maculatus TaxID=64391 RepID=A0A653D0J4_CALMS|nr:unnamed protein product [Callosobruchus maculatus]
MADEWEEILLLFAVSIIMIIILLLLRYIQYQREQVKHIEETIRTAQQQDRVYSISEQVQSNAWSSRDAYLAVGHITAEHQMNKPNYDDAPPSYEEAMRIATTTNGESSTVVTVSTLPKEPN